MEKHPQTISGNKRLIIILSLAAVLLSIPLIAMQLSDEVNWKPFDFLIAGILLFGSGLLCELVLRKVPGTTTRVALCVGVLLLLVLVWLELAVGIFGSPLAGS